MTSPHGRLPGGGRGRRTRAAVGSERPDCSRTPPAKARALQRAHRKAPSALQADTGRPNANPTATRSRTDEPGADPNPSSCRRYLPLPRSVGNSNSHAMGSGTTIRDPRRWPSPDPAGRHPPARCAKPIEATPPTTHLRNRLQTLEPIGLQQALRQNDDPDRAFGSSLVVQTDDVRSIRCRRRRPP